MLSFSASVCFCQSGAPGDRVDSPLRRHWQESVLVSAEDPSASRTTRASPSHQRNGHEDRTGSVSRTEETRGSTQQTHPEHLSTGPASRAAKGSSSSIPYIDCSDIDNEYKMGRDQVSRLNHSSREQVSGRRGSGSGSINRALQAQQEHFLGRMQHKESPSSKPLLNMSHELNESHRQSYQRVEQSPLHCTLTDVSAHSRERRSSSPLTVPHVMGSVSGITSPVMDTFHQAASLSHAEQNGSAPPRFDEGRYSPIPSRSPCLQKPHRMRHHSNFDPNQEASSPESRPVLSRAERMAALERRMMANGLSAPGKSRASPGQKRLGQHTHVGAVQINDCSTTSGSESSESEVEPNMGNRSSPLMFDSPVEANSTSPIPRNKFSFGSLQLDEEADEDGCHAFSDDDGGQIFSC